MQNDNNQVNSAGANPESTLAPSTENKLPASESELAMQLIKDYGCTTALERSLCEIIAINYRRVINASKSMDVDFNLHWPSKEKIHYLEILSKELDRQNRSYLTAINTLLGLKNPKLTINVNTENAFLGENQQFNTNRPSDENIKGKSFRGKVFGPIPQDHGKVAIQTGGEGTEGSALEGKARRARDHF